MEKETEKANHHKVLEQAMVHYKQKEERMKNKLASLKEEQDSKLDERIKQRKEMIEMRRSMFSDDGRGNFSPTSSHPTINSCQ